MGVLEHCLGRSLGEQMRGAGECRVVSRAGKQLSSLCELTMISATHIPHLLTGRGASQGTGPSENPAGPSLLQSNGWMSPCRFYLFPGCTGANSLPGEGLPGP